MEDLIFEVKDDEQNIKQYEMLLSFKNDNINYIVYTDNTYNENNELNIYASSYDIIDNKINLKQLKNEDEYEVVNKKILEFISK